MSSNADHNYEMIKFVRRGYRRGQVPVCGGQVFPDTKIGVLSTDSRSKTEGGR